MKKKTFMQFGGKNANVMKFKKKKVNYNPIILRYSLLTSLKNRKLFGTYLIEP